MLSLLLVLPTNPSTFTRHWKEGKKMIRVRWITALFLSLSLISLLIPVSQSTTEKSNKIGKTTRAPRRLVTISTGDGKWHGEWTSDYKLTLQDLQLQDLVEVEEDKKKNAQVLVSLSIQKHASFGLTVDGNIVTSFTRKCSNCSAPYCRQVIYVRPGNEADLDCLIQDTIRLSTPVKDTCSELCEKSEATLQYTGGVNSSIDKRWSRLYELKNGRL
ncbi:large ribosomal RNA subunit accumulation protein YCED homolog 2, chloroplastic isoform X4 [Neltuma alba]|uniref:large ribosomal RNA subunit accumulation protein YCED homolog 2, chloroplastic isoform X4 n=1 Tax=Neltuma alba TaxID=207710 RepID=UPI0010A2F0D7|nr:large ribosomal RNA subunit accumulation protein YCED homolog 2, chloroplastic isoform X4 [Prosopis alba]